MDFERSWLILIALLIGTIVGYIFYRLQNKEPLLTLHGSMKPLIAGLIATGATVVIGEIFLLD